MTSLTALQGAIGFLTRVPVGHSESAWLAFQRRPETMIIVGYLLGLLLSVPLLAVSAGLYPPATVGVLFPVWLVLLAGITHLDGVADCADAAVSHGAPEDRQSILADTTVGVGAVTALALVVLGLATAAYTLSTFPLVVAMSVLLTAEVTAKAGMVTLAIVGTPTHDGLGAAISGGLSLRRLWVVGALVVPAIVVGRPLVVMAAIVLGGSAVAGLVLLWARSVLGGVSGDVFGATNELIRVVGLHIGLSGYLWVVP